MLVDCSIKHALLLFICFSFCSEGLYHCDYCHKDLSSTLRIKCAVCKDFDLCLECFRFVALAMGRSCRGQPNAASDDEKVASLAIYKAAGVTAGLAALQLLPKLWHPVRIHHAHSQPPPPPPTPPSHPTPPLAASVWS
jgi:hypothetical protein